MWSQVGLCSSLWTKLLEVMEFQLSYFKSWKMMLWKHSICQQTWKTQQGPQDCKRSVFIPIPKKDNAKKCPNYHIIALISHASKGMLKILQARLQQYMNHEIPDVEADFRKGRGTRDQIANIHWIIEKARVPEKHLFLLYWLCKVFDCVGHNKLWKVLKEMGIPDHLTCVLRNL